MIFPWLTRSRCRRIRSNRFCRRSEASPAFPKVEPCGSPKRRRSRSTPTSNSSSSTTSVRSCSSASKKDAMIGRYWRNVGVLRGHLAHQSDSAAINYGRIHFGQSPVGIA